MSFPYGRVGVKNQPVGRPTHRGAAGGPSPSEARDPIPKEDAMRHVSFVPWAVVLACAAGSAGQDNKPSEKPSPVVGSWKATDRHVAIGSLFQPVHGVRKRESMVCFRQDGGRLSGYAIHEDHAAITHQERWKDGHTNFRSV